MFNKQNFCHVASNNRNEKKAGIFVYKTTDNLATVSASGYFNEKIIDLNLHDLIIHEQTDNADKTKVKYNYLAVTERTLDNVGTTVIKRDLDISIEEAIEELRDYVDETFVKKDGSSIMTGPLKFRAGSFEGAIAGGLGDGVSVYKLKADGSIDSEVASLTKTNGFVPGTNNAINIGRNNLKWKDAYIARVITAVLNNGYDIAVPGTNSADTLALVNADINPLQQQINHLQTIGRFLSFWDATTGLAQTNPQTSPYIYQTGDYFRVGVVASGGGINYKPSGSSYTIGVASTVVETEPLTVGQVYYYDGTNWALAAGGNVAIDETTIVLNTDNELQAVATVNKNPAAGATNPVYDWVGTLAEYNAQNIETLHPDWLCYITDDVSGGGSVFDTLYPVGSIYMGVLATCPLTTIIPGSVWTLVASKIVIHVPNTVPVKGNGMTLGLTDGTDFAGLQKGTDTWQGQTFGYTVYGTNVGTTGSSWNHSNDKSWGVTTDSTKSGIVADMSSVNTITTNVWIRTA